MSEVPINKGPLKNNQITPSVTFSLLFYRYPYLLILSVKLIKLIKE